MPPRPRPPPEPAATPERYGLSFVGRAAAVGEAEAPAQGTLLAVPELSFGTGSRNQIIEGDNLAVLRLLRERIAGQVKLIYIDPPYNTGNDFLFRDKFHAGLRDYLRDTSQAARYAGRKGPADDCELDGRFHSPWLAMMYPRLRLARELLRPDGVLAVSIDAHEDANLTLLLDEIFGLRSRIGTIAIQSNPRGRHLARFIATSHELVHLYARDIAHAVIHPAPLTAEQRRDYRLQDEHGAYRLLGLRKRGAFSRQTDRPTLHYPLYCDPQTQAVDVEARPGWVAVVPHLSSGEPGVWRWCREKVRSERAQLVGRLVRGRQQWDVFQKDYLGEGAARKHRSLWADSAVNYEHGRRELRALFGEAVFDAVKPLGLMRRLVQLGSAGEDLVLDFFAGSGTTAHAVLLQNAADGGRRRFICVQAAEPVAAETVAARCGFRDVAEICRERVRRAAATLDESGAKSGATSGADADRGFEALRFHPEREPAMPTLQPSRPTQGVKRPTRPA